MGMKKIKIGLLALLYSTLAFAVAGCAAKHEHTFSEGWAFDATSHWHPASCSHDVKSAKSEHSFEKTVIPATTSGEGYTLYVCACGYSYVDDVQSALPLPAAGYGFNEEGHWNIQVEGEVTPTPHVYKTENDVTVDATCTSAGYVKHTCECGYWYAERTADPLKHTVNEKVLANDGSAHWHLCSVCGLKVDSVAHTLEEHLTTAYPCAEGAKVQVHCKECGYSAELDPADTSHTYEEGYHSDTTQHWREPICGHGDDEAPNKDVGDHVYAEGSNICLICGAEGARQLAFKLSDAQEYYIVTGIGSIKETAITIPSEYNKKSVKEIAPHAFENSEITGVTFQGEIDTIGAKAFAGSSLNKKVTLSGAVTLGQSVFEDCASLPEIDLGSSTAIPVAAFAGCTALQTVTGSDVAAVGARAFEDCAALKELPTEKVTSVGFAAFSGCASFAPESVVALQTVEEYAFAGTGIKSVTAPVLSAVPAHLFEDCQELIDLTLSAASIGASAFENCGQLANVILTNTQTVGENAFKGCLALGTLALPETVIRVAASAFDGTKLVTSESGATYAANVLVGISDAASGVALKTGTIGVADGVCEGKTTLTSITFAAETRFIGVNAFRGCTGLTQVTFTEGIEDIGANAFRESGLISVTVPASVTSIGDNAFYDCENLTSAEIHAANIGKFAFSYTGVGRDLDHEVKHRPDYAKLNSVTLGTDVKTIGSNAFQYAPITEITLQGVETIGQYAFAQTDLTEVTIPATVTFIGQYAFYETQLTTATFDDQNNWNTVKRGEDGEIKTPLTIEVNAATQLKDMTIDWKKGA